MNKKLVSFIVPAQGAEVALGSTLDSIANQKTSHPFEIIVVLEVGSVFDSVHPITKIFLPKLGAAHARNGGIKVANGAFLAFVDCDTVLSPDWLELMMKALSEGEWLGCQGQIVAGSHSSGSLFADFREISSELSYRGMILADYSLPIINSAACLFHNVSQLSYDENLKAAEDIELSWRLISIYSMGFRYVEEAVAISYFSSENFLSFCLRNWRIGSALKNIVNYPRTSSELFQKRFKTGLNRSLLGELRLLKSKPHPAILLRAMASLVTYLSFSLSKSLDQGEIKPIAESNVTGKKIKLNGHTLNNEERLITYQGKLRLLNIRELRSKYFGTYEILVNQEGEMFILGIA
jgi:glycosyltransferase involved in cell wall biosynthesis